VWCRCGAGMVPVGSPKNENRGLGGPGSEGFLVDSGGSPTDGELAKSNGGVEKGVSKAEAIMGVMTSEGGIRRRPFSTRNPFAGILRKPRAKNSGRMGFL
jgi:hypothetical protein